jgi:peptidyl-tRNA hydrolase ICT1
VNTKATLRFSLNDSWVPCWALPTLKKTVRHIPKYSNPFHSLSCSLITFRRHTPYSLHAQCIVHRPKTSTNVCKSMFTLDNRLRYFLWMYFQLHSLILSVVFIPIEKGPSKEQKKQVERLMSAAHAQRKADKMKRSSVLKEGGSGKGSYDY